MIPPNQSKMERVLADLANEASIPKFHYIKKTCQEAIEFITSPNASDIPVHQLRNRCLQPFQMALETRTKRLSNMAIKGIELILQDDQFQSSLESESEEDWMPIQILNTVYSTPHLQEDAQVEILKLLLNMTFSTAWCMNSKIIIEISQVYIKIFVGGTISVQTAIKATITQMLSCFTKRLQETVEKNKVPRHGKERKDNNVMKDFEPKDFVNMDCALQEVISILKFFTKKLEETQNNNVTSSKHSIPLLLECILTILSNSSKILTRQSLFVDLLWKHLCPALISLLGTPRSERSVTTPRNPDEEIGRGSGCSTTAPNLLATTAKVIYNIAVQLVRLVGSVGSLRPVLESLFHRMLLYPPPQHRHDALKALKLLFNSPRGVLDIAAPTASESSNSDKKLSNQKSDIAFMKLIIDSIQECCHCNDSAVCITSVECITMLLRTLERLSKGIDIPEDVVRDINSFYDRQERDSKLNLNIEPEGTNPLNPLPPTEVEPADIPKTAASDSLEGEEVGGEDVEVGRGGGEEEVREVSVVIVEKEEEEEAEEEKIDNEEDEDERVDGESQQEIDDAACDDDDSDEDTCSDSSVVSHVYCPPHPVQEPENLPNDTSSSTSAQETLPKKTAPGSTTSKAFLCQKQDLAEREHAREYMGKLADLLPRLMNLMSICRVDNVLQEFAASFCSDMVNGFPAKCDESTVIVNADGIYVTSIAVLSLNLKLSVKNFYNPDFQGKVLVTEEQFVDNVLNSGLVVFLSTSWLSEVYKQIISTNLLENAGYQFDDESPLISMLTDIDGLDSHELCGQILMDARTTCSTLLSDDDDDEEEEERDEEVDSIRRGENRREGGHTRRERPSKDAVMAGKRLAKRILSTCWDGMLDVLAVLLNGKSSCGITSSLALMLGTEGAREESMKAREAICQSLTGLQKAAKLCCILGLQKRCAAVFALLASSSCVIEERSVLHDRKLPLKAPILPNRQKLVRLHAAHILSMDVVMLIGLEMGSHASDCWKHIFRCCSHIAWLEHTYFSAGNNQSSLPKVHHEQPVMSIPNADGSYNCDPEMYMTSMVPVMPVAPTISVHELTRLSKVEAGWESALSGGGVLSASHAAKALCGLSQEVDRLFEDAAQKLNLQALVSFLSELCTASHHQLVQLSTINDDEEIINVAIKLPTNALLLYRLQEVLMKVLHTGRPLLHLVQAFNAVSTHLVEAAGNRERRISKMAVTCMHDYITSVLSTHTEKPHFHVNELLCKGFESLFSMDICDGDVQDQVVCSICELVEACTAEIRSGWRPLFAALQAVKIEYTLNEEINESRQRHIAAVLDVFEVFLNTDNILVFANAAVDCILCLLKYVRGPGEFECSSDGDSDSGSDFATNDCTENLCLPALNYLKQCCHMLASMWKMPQSPIFNSAHRIQVGFLQEIVDPNISNMDFELFKQNFSSVDSTTTTTKTPTSTTTTNSSESKSNIPQGENLADPVVASQPEMASNRDRRNSPTDSHSITSQDSGLDVPTTEKLGLMENLRCEDRVNLYQMISLESLDNHCGLLHVWFLILDGLASATAVCPRTYQPQTMEMLFELLRETTKTPGPTFSMFCVNNLLLPTLQSWLRRSYHNQTYWETGSTNFKLCCGLTTDLLVEFVLEFSDDHKNEKMLETMLYKLFIVLIECVAQPVEVISRLGCSCIRHIVLASGHCFTEGMWQVTIDSFEKAFEVTTYSLRQLMMLFHQNSENFYGDIGQVKVATRKDCTPIALERLRQLAQQVFLLDSQIQGGGHNLSCNSYSDVDTDKSYIFLLYPPVHDANSNPEHLVTRVPFRNLVVGLLSHQLLLQTVGSILLQLQTSTEPDSGVRNCADNNNTTHSSTEQQQQHQQQPQSMSSPSSAPPSATSSPSSSNSSSPLPGMLPYLSTRNVAKVLDCLYMSYHIACDFDSRPGLKFLIQKVAQTDVAANLYKQAGASMVFYIHTLIEICSSVSPLQLDTTRNLLKQMSTSFLNNRQACITRAQTVTKDISSNVEIFLFLLQSICDELCQTYVDMTLDEETTTCVDRLSEQPLVFLIAKPDELSDITGSTESKKMNKSPSFKGSLYHPTTSPVATQPAEAPFGSDSKTAATRDDPISPSKSTSEEDKDHPDVTNTLKSKKEKRAEREGRVYTVATDKFIKNLMTEYKKRKQQHSMPAFVKATKVDQSKHSEATVPPTPREPVAQEIEKQQKFSIMKDSEAHLKSWTELLCAILRLFQELPDHKFYALLPTVFNCLNQLVCHSREQRLNDALAQWLHRVGHLVGINPL
ncbi:brefeldin A-inhibited guanine nucleotide-exchange protein 3 isoform X1 [Octopus sinensis]|uniref:Brefeldin A-inhibited guanine nucleotide-exchange protein 3 isoform X1 n=1 Tax=Octopus sinensis TaxID=2607531 RepID=A0A6P7TLU4_9MOLL|nr:brefeldin A-inhibited guanine nucleotide-exchange protein 3 isoform X1 [Octopus sinensis]